MTIKHAAIAPLLLALALPAWARVYTFKDWAVACDNIRRCQASGSQAEDGDNPVALLLTRTAGPGSAMAGRLSVADPDDGKIGALTLRVGKLKWTGITPDQAFAPARAALLLAAMRDADAMTLDDGRRRWTLSLAGLKAALLKIDEIQGRIGTRGALARPGDKPESAVPPAPTAPLVAPAATPAARPGDKALLPALLKRLKAADATCWNEQPDAEQPDAELYRLGASQLLVLRECGRAAYQSNYKAWIVDDKPPFRSRAAMPRDEDGKDAPLIGAAFERGVLSSYAKGRGIGDCGGGASWAWTGGDFQLMSAEEAPQCRGIPGGVPLRTWVSRQH
ncbi:DUF1176 domain-containing protein [Chromobacterium sp. ATCC 53434]|uniref:DUF1176 domain-containing protein n=1 Tax=Chromobacterium sp. (strain ATCC 53434 / SC 14030) TaxID=2059672 RepID=UPI00130541F3|nr:DUF1176 domain-containing protein [Chromobacterium sp. ATCC 53434]